MRETLFSRRIAQREAETGLTDTESLDRDVLYARLRSAIGNTLLREIELPNGNLLLQKDETTNPTESHYDRCYVELLHSLEKKGNISQGDTLLETTSGSAGVSFAWMCHKLGFPAHIFMPSYVPEPRIIEVKRFAEAVHLNDDKERYVAACAEDMVSYLKANKSRVHQDGQRIWMPNHSQDPRTPSTFEAIGDEVAATKKELGVDYFIGGVGNGSTLLGVGQAVKRLWKNAKVVAYEPSRACPFYSADKKRWGSIAPKLAPDSDIPTEWQFHDMPGTGGFGNINFPFMNTALERGVIDDIVHVPDKTILSQVRYNQELPSEMQQGHTSLVSRFIAEQIAQKVRGKVFLVLAYDRADRYGKPRYVS